MLTIGKVVISSEQLESTSESFFYDGCWSYVPSMADQRHLVIPGSRIDAGQVYLSMAETPSDTWFWDRCWSYILVYGRDS